MAFRFWLVGVVMWLGFWALVALTAHTGDEMRLFGPVAVIPPLAVLGVGSAIRWAIGR